MIKIKLHLILRFGPLTPVGIVHSIVLHQNLHISKINLNLILLFKE